MTINKLSLNTPTPETISVSFEIDQFISHTTDDTEIESVISDISSVLENHLKFFREQKIQQEAQRVANEHVRLAALEAETQKSRKVFSTFKTTNEQKNVITENDTAKYLARMSLDQAIVTLQKIGMIPPTYLPNVYRIDGSPYAYTVKSNSWTSPFGDSGDDALSLLNNISEKILKHTDRQRTEFLMRVTKVWEEMNS